MALLFLLAAIVFAVWGALVACDWVTHGNEEVLLFVVLGCIAAAMLPWDAIVGRVRRRPT